MWDVLCGLFQLEQVSMKRVKTAKHSSWWQYPCRGCSAMWMAWDGESGCSFSIVTILPFSCTGRKVWSSYCHVMLEDPSPLNFGFLQVYLLLYGRLAHSATLVLAIMVNSLTESQEASKFHSQRSLSMWIPVCVTNFNLWPSGSLRPRLCGVRMTHQPSPGNLWYRCSCCQQRSTASVIVSDICPTEVGDTCKSYSLLWV